MMKESIHQVIRQRRSVFPPQYNEKEISKEFIEQLLENANWAPTHKLTEPWRFKVVRNKAKDRLGDFLADTYTDITGDEKFSPFKHKKIRNNCRSANVVIAICMQRDPKERIAEWEEIAATAMAVQNMWLTCSAYEVGCYWSSPQLIDYAGDFFDLEEGERCLGFFYLGNFDQEDSMDSKRGPISEKTIWME